MKEQVRAQLKELTTLTGISGQEQKICKCVKEKFEKLCDSVTVDPIGNVIGIKKGNKEGKKLMIIAHMDEIGFIVKNILPNGFISFDKVGSQSNKVMEGRKVIIDGKYMGVIGIKPGHLTTPTEGMTVKTPKECYIDVCCNSKEEVLALGIDIGSAVTFQSDFDVMPNSDYICTKSVDDRAGIVVMLQILEQIKDGNFAGTIHMVASVQEETGMKGAKVAANAICPDYAIVLDTVPSGDTPDVDTIRDLPIRLGHGPGCILAEGYAAALAFTFPSKKVVEKVQESADKNNINLQKIALSGDGYMTDSYQVSQSGVGTPCAILTIPRRYSHSPVEVVNLNDILGAITVLKGVIDENGNIDLNFI